MWTPTNFRKLSGATVVFLNIPASVADLRRPRPVQISCPAAAVSLIDFLGRCLECLVHLQSDSAAGDILRGRLLGHRDDWPAVFSARKELGPRLF